MSSIGIFPVTQDVGSVLLAGSASFDGETYSLTGSGYNMWFARDAFRGAFTPVSGDVTLAGEISFPAPGKDPHRKAGLLVRQDLDEDSVYASIAVHGDGLTSLQFRDEKGGTTREIRSRRTANGPIRVRIEKQGEFVTFSLGQEGNEWEPGGGHIRLPLSDSFLIGLCVCSHLDDTLETAEFRDVSLDLSPAVPAERTLVSMLETIHLASTDRQVVYVTRGHIEAPNWTPDGETLIFNGGGRLYRIPAKGGEPQEIPTGFAIRCNNDHGISPDGATLVISDQSQPPHQSIIYTLPISGGEPTRITENFPSYWHGWSPDGETLAYCAQRDGKYGIFTIPVNGGEETRLTITDGLDDGPEYSPDGQYIYFNSDRTGLMQIWRMRADGSELEQVTDGDAGYWFAHPSPDGKWLAMLVYDKSVKGHPADQNVELHVRSVSTGEIRVVARLFGGQGTINVPSWSPDSQHFSFVSYQYQ